MVTQLESTARRVVAYVRVSTHAQAAKGSGLATQEADCRAWAKANGFRIVKVHSDPAVSGQAEIAARPGLVAALSDLQDRRAGGILVQRLDRIARELVLQEAFLGELRRLGAACYSTSSAERDVLEASAKDPARNLIRQVLGALSEYEAAMVRLRLAAGRERKRSWGGYAGGRPPLGMRAEGGRLLQDAREQAVIVRILELRREGLSFRQVAGVLEDEGYRTKDNRRSWHPETIRRLVARIDPTGEVSSPLDAEELAQLAQWEADQAASDAEWAAAGYPEEPATD